MLTISITDWRQIQVMTVRVARKNLEDSQRYAAKRRIKTYKIIPNRKNKTRIKWLK